MLGIRKINQGILHLPLYGLPVKKTRPRASKNPSFFFLLNTILVNVQNFETDSSKEKIAKNISFLPFSSPRIVSICLSIKKEKQTRFSRFFTHYDKYQSKFSKIFNL